MITSNFYHRWMIYIQKPWRLLLSKAVASFFFTLSKFIPRGNFLTKPLFFHPLCFCFTKIEKGWLLAKTFLHPSTEMKLFEESAKELHPASRTAICWRNYDDIFRVIIRRISTQWCRVLECPQLLVLLSILKNALFSSNFLLRSEMFLCLASHFSFNYSFVFSKRICLFCLCFRRDFAVKWVVNEIIRLVCFLQVFHCGVFSVCFVWIRSNLWCMLCILQGFLRCVYLGLLNT